MEKYMINNILRVHKEMMFNFMDVCDMDEYGLAWFCFMKGVIVTSIIVWMF